MNCTGLNLTDCPPVDKSILTLILDDNLIKEFDTPNCKNWTNNENLSIRRNKLESFKIDVIDEPIVLKSIDLSQNKLNSIHLNSDQITFVNLSHNSISYSNSKSNSMFLSLKGLKKFIISNNLIDNKGLENLIHSILSSPSLSLLDVSYNKFNKTPSYLMSLSMNNELLINFTGNYLSGFFFYKYKFSIDFDLSFNRIADITGNDGNTVQKLNLSHNKLSNIDIKTLSKFVHLELFDLSDNPLNCFCNESASFIQWMINNKNKIDHRNKTVCDKPDKKSIFDIKCTNGSLSTIPSVITSTFHSTHSTHPPHPPNPSEKHTAIWKVVVPIIIIILLVIFGIFIYFKCRRRNGYQRIGESPNYSPLLGCECLQMLSFRPRRNSELRVYQEENIQDSYSGGRLNFEVTLNVICSSKDRKWTIRNVTSQLDIKKNIISYKVKNLPFCDYTLIVVNGDNCFKDNTFVNNGDKCFNQKDVKILINEIPTLENCRVNSLFIDFLKDKLDNNSYYKYNAIDSDSCLSNLKIWLKLDFIPHNV